MCGIAAYLSVGPVDSLKEGLREAIVKRGPDHICAIEVSASCWLISSILHIQGSHMALQPYENANSYLCWNGEIFSGLEGYPDNLSDTAIASTLLDRSIADALLMRSEDGIEEVGKLSKLGECITSALSVIEGPYAFIFYHKGSQTIFYGRDPFGRRSLLHSVSSSELLISSVAPHHVTDDLWDEVPIGGIFAARLSSCGSNDGTNLLKSFIPWPGSRLRLGRSACPRKDSLSAGIAASSSPSEIFLKRVVEAVRKRVRVLESGAGGHQQQMPHAAIRKACRVGVLFSGGVDSMLLAAVLHVCLPEDEPIDLFNVAFESADDETFCYKEEKQGQQNCDCDRVCSLEETTQRAATASSCVAASVITSSVTHSNEKSQTPAPDRLAAISALAELKKCFPSRCWQLVHVDVPSSKRIAAEEHIKGLIYPLNTVMDLNIGTALWFAAKGEGYLREYSELEVVAAQSSNDPTGRPLVRVGAEDAAKSVGLKTWTQHKLAATSDASSEGQSSSTNKKKSSQISCENLDCRRVGKPGCLRGYCKKCCNMAQNNEVAAFYTDCASSGTLVRESELRSAVTDCSIHQFLWDNKLCEKLKLQYAELISEEQSKRRPETNKSSSPIITGGAAEDGTEPETSAGSSDSRIMEESSTAAPAAALLSASNTNDRRICDDPTRGTGYHSCTSTASSSTSKSTTTYRSPCKVLLVGVGADEQMAGYGRHRTAYLRGGNDALEAELNIDCQRLWQRNLGRDDRCISDSGREAWFPFIDEGVVELLQGLPLSDIATLEDPPGVGDKRILRDALKSMGLHYSCQIVKRAIQFGTLIAKHTNLIAHGSIRKGKGTTSL